MNNPRENERIGIWFPDGRRIVGELRYRDDEKVTLLEDGNSEPTTYRMDEIESVHQL